MKDNAELSPPAVNSDGVPILGLNAKQAARACSLSVRKLWELTNRGEIPHKRIGTCIVYSVDALRRWLLESDAKCGRAKR